MKSFTTTLLLLFGATVFAQNIPAGAIAINEFVADNDSTSMINDPDGGYPDWIELYNNTGAAIDLSDVVLSDKPNNLLKWRFPEGTSIAANGYLIVWADEDGDEQGLHANFKLNREGEAIYLSNAGDSTRIDEVVFGEQTTNVSQSRVPNGTGNFVAQHTTHGFSNDTPVSTRAAAELTLPVAVYPNPAGEVLYVRLPTELRGGATATVWSAAGRQVGSALTVRGQRVAIDLTDLPAGAYVLRVTNPAGRGGVVRFLRR